MAATLRVLPAFFLFFFFFVFLWLRPVREQILTSYAGKAPVRIRFKKMGQGPHFFKKRFAAIKK
jgi:hypothetical protein